MQDLGWRDSIIEVLKAAAEPLHYTDITDRIVEQELKTEFGATPAKSVSASITMSLKEEGEESPFVRVGRGIYALRSAITSELEATASSSGYAVATAVAEQAVEPDEMGLINAFGMYWKRDAVRWVATPKILGQQQVGASSVDFSGQRGVYLLHDSRDVVYVGRTTDQPLGKRLFLSMRDSWPRCAREQPTSLLGNDCSSIQ